MAFPTPLPPRAHPASPSPADKPPPIMLQLTPAAGSTGPVAFTCGAAPKDSTCTVNPASVQLTSGVTASVTVTITTIAAAKIEENQGQASRRSSSRDACHSDSCFSLHEFAAEDCRSPPCSSLSSSLSVAESRPLPAHQGPPQPPAPAQRRPPTPRSSPPLARV